MAIRAVIFDYGMVLSQPQEPAALKNLLTITGLDHDTFDRHYWTHRHAYDMGQLDGPAYWKKFASDTAIELTATDIERLIENDVLMWCTINEPMLKWAKSLTEAGLKIGILSNMGEDTLAYMRQEFSWLGDFDHHTWSCELGIAKPDPAIYIHTCEKLGVAPA
ncbi:HAD-IA family hydrolase, partial [Alloacidobacterium sp.]|uniref:HAD-IA family hydrolase n=1 Tax=Alloacidobacterium sp. TaxID=2951999 RepID=UPI002D35CE70